MNRSKKIINGMEFEEITSGQDKGLLDITEYVLNHSCLSVITVLAVLADHGYDDLIISFDDASIYVGKSLESDRK